MLNCFILYDTFLEKVKAQTEIKQQAYALPMN